MLTRAHQYAAFRLRGTVHACLASLPLLRCSVILDHVPGGDSSLVSRGIAELWVGCIAFPRHLAAAAQTMAVSIQSLVKGLADECRLLYLQMIADAPIADCEMLML